MLYEILSAFKYEILSAFKYKITTYFSINKISE